MLIFQVGSSGGELTPPKALPTTRRIELMGIKEFAVAALNPEHEIYVVHIVSFSSTPLVTLEVYPSRKPQISGISGLIVEEALKKVPTKYSDFADIFSPDLASELLEHIRINDHAIELVDADGFIRPFNAPAGALIFFDQVSDRSLRLYIDCRSLNNLTIAMSALIAKTVKIAITNLTLLDKLGKVWFFQKIFCWLMLA